MRARRTQAGFSLIELIIALVASALIFISLLPFFVKPLEAMVAGSHTSEIVEHAERALGRLASELPNALPNSPRVACGGQCLEFIPVLDQADYRAFTPGDKLDFAAADTSFDVLMPLAAAPASGLELIINNQGSGATGTSSAYSADAISNRGVVAAGTTSSNIRVASKLYPAPSARQRFFIVGSPVSYLCAPSASGGTLRRYSGYATAAAQPTNAALGDLIASGVVGCQFTVNDARLVSVRLIAGDASMDSVTMQGEFRVVAMP